MHDDGETAYNILWKVMTDELGDVDKSYEQMKAKNLTPERYPALNVELLKRGWVIIDDKAWEIPRAMAKDKEAVLRAEEQVMQYVSKGPILLIYEGAGGGVQLDLDDVEETGTLSDAIEHAKTRATAPATESNITNFNLGSWVSAGRRMISYFR
jgi:hypothetical protein